MILTTLMLAACWVLLEVGRVLLRALLGELLLFLDKAMDLLAVLFFFLVIVPPLWLWEKGRRPMWRTLTRQQTRELEAWLIHRR
jgi:hypothetical protein